MSDYATPRETISRSKRGNHTMSVIRRTPATETKTFKPFIGTAIKEEEKNTSISSTAPSVTSVYLRTSTGTVKAHMANSLINKGIAPCVFIFEDPHLQQIQKVPMIDAAMGAEKEEIMRGIQDVFFPQIDDNEIEQEFPDVERVIVQSTTKEYSSMKRIVVNTDKEYAVLTLDSSQSHPAACETTRLCVIDRDFAVFI